MKKMIVVLSLIAAVRSSAQINVVPMPAEVKVEKGFCVIKEPVGFIAADYDKEGGNDGVKSFQQYLRKTYNVILFIDGDTHSYGLPTEIFYSTAEGNKPEGYYELEVTKNEITIRGSALGKFYAFETLKQLITRNSNHQLVIPHCKIKDYPRFKYRGMHLDVARHFFPVAFVKKYIDYLAAYKFNTFHWHLTDDQGWRIEIKKYPRLTEVGGYRNGTIIGRYPGKGNDSIRYGGFYTQQQIKEVVKYAADRHITIIPEIELPGHASAAIAAYPQLSCFPDESTKVPDNTTWAGSTAGKQVQQTWGVFEDVLCPNEYTFTFMQNVLSEVMQLFPSKYIHIGGDESPKEAWKRSAFCQQFIKEKNLKDEHELQSYFIQRIEKYINSKGRKIIGWDEILEGGLAPNATVMSWRGEEGGIAAAKQDHNVIMTPGAYCYIDHSQSQNEDSVTIGGYLPLEKVYSYDPVPAALNEQQAKHILGAQGNVWTEYMSNASKVEYMIFPRMAALSEVVWTPKEKKNWGDFEKRLPVLLQRLEEQHINYSKAYYDLQEDVLPAANNNGIIYRVIKRKNAKQTIVTTQYYSYDTLTVKYWHDKNGRIKDSSLLKSYGYTQDTNADTVYLNIDKDTKWVSASLFNVGPPYPAPYPFEYFFHEVMPFISTHQNFNFNKATGKKITLVTPLSKAYPGNGAFTLVDGIQNTKGLEKSNEFLGFLGKDLDVAIDLGNTTINKITIHVLEQSGSWIYLPSQVEVTYLPDSVLTADIVSAAPKKILNIDPATYKGAKTIVIENEQQCRYIKIVVKNYGIIPQGNPGAGNPAWLFVDEIEVE